LLMARDLEYGRDAEADNFTGLSLT
jgi:hypothetical protein